MKNDVWSTVVNSATALLGTVKGPWRKWVIRPIVTVVAAFAIMIATAIYAGWTSVPDIWNSDVWKDH